MLNNKKTSGVPVQILRMPIKNKPYLFVSECFPIQYFNFRYRSRTRITSCTNIIECSYSQRRNIFLLYINFMQFLRDTDTQGKRFTASTAAFTPSAHSYRLYQLPLLSLYEYTSEPPEIQHYTPSHTATIGHLLHHEEYHRTHLADEP